MHLFCCWTCLFFLQFSPSSLPFLIIFHSCTVMSSCCLNHRDNSGQSGDGSTSSRVFLAPNYVSAHPASCARVTRWRDETEGALEQFAHLLPSCLGSPGGIECWEEGEKKGKGRKGTHIYLMCNFLGRLAGLIIRCITYTWRLSVSGVVTWVQGSIIYADGENSDISNPLVGWQLAKNKFLIFLWMCLVNHFFFPSHLIYVFNALFLCALITKEDRFSRFFCAMEITLFLHIQQNFMSDVAKYEEHLFMLLQCHTTEQSSCALFSFELVSLL